MGRAYACVMGPLALVTMIVRGWKHGCSAETTLWQAALSLAAFAIVGFVTGQVAGWIIDDSVRSRIQSELAKNSQDAGK